jgi:hypothetical protein
MMGITKTSFSLSVGQWATEVCAIGLSVSLSPQPTVCSEPAKFFIASLIALLSA